MTLGVLGMPEGCPDRCKVVQFILHGFDFSKTAQRSNNKIEKVLKTRDRPKRVNQESVDEAVGLR